LYIVCVMGSFLVVGGGGGVGGVTGHEMCILIFSTTLSKNIFQSKIIRQNIIISPI